MSYPYHVCLLRLSQDAIRFDAFLKENDKLAHEAVKSSEREARVKADKLAEIKKMKHAIAIVESEKSKLLETLEDFERYRQVCMFVCCVLLCSYMCKRCAHGLLGLSTAVLGAAYAAGMDTRPSSQEARAPTKPARGEACAKGAQLGG